MMTLEQRQSKCANTSMKVYVSCLKSECHVLVRHLSLAVAEQLIITVCKYNWLQLNIVLSIV